VGNIGIEETGELGPLWGLRVGNRFAPALISLALDEVDATDVRQRLRGNADAGRAEAIVTDDSGLGRPEACFVAGALQIRSKAKVTISEMR
jgi:hypothetical protein